MLPFLLEMTHQGFNIVRSATIKRCSRQIPRVGAWPTRWFPMSQQRFEKSVKLNWTLCILNRFDKLPKWLIPFHALGGLCWYNFLIHWWHARTYGENCLKCQMNGLAYTTCSRRSSKPDRPRQNLAPRILHLLAHDGWGLPGRSSQTLPAEMYQL